mgnify:CR=1 FL=1
MTLYNMFALNPSSIVFSLYQGEEKTWKPIWYVAEIECDLPINVIEAGYTNTGKQVDEKTAKLIGEKILKCLKSGKFHEYVRNHEEKISKISNENHILRNIISGYSYSIEEFKTFGNFCINSGGFKVL